MLLNLTVPAKESMVNAFLINALYYFNKLHTGDPGPSGLDNIVVPKEIRYYQDDYSYYNNTGFLYPPAINYPNLQQMKTVSVVGNDVYAKTFEFTSLFFINYYEWRYKNGIFTAEIEETCTIKYISWWSVIQGSRAEAYIGAVELYPFQEIHVDGSMLLKFKRDLFDAACIGFGVPQPAIPS